jgi:hypothetical protein
LGRWRRGVGEVAEQGDTDATTIKLSRMVRRQGERVGLVDATKAVHDQVVADAWPIEIRYVVAGNDFRANRGRNAGMVDNEMANLLQGAAGVAQRGMLG